MRVPKQLVVAVLLAAAGTGRAQPPAGGRGEVAAPARGGLPRLEVGGRAAPRPGPGSAPPWSDAGVRGAGWGGTGVADGPTVGPPTAGAYGRGRPGPAARRRARPRVRPLVIVVGAPLVAPAPAPAPDDGAPDDGAAADDADDAEGQEPARGDAGEPRCDEPGASRCVDVVRRVGRTKVIEVGAARPGRVRRPEHARPDTAPARAARRRATP